MASSPKTIGHIWHECTSCTILEISCLQAGSHTHTYPRTHTRYQWLHRFLMLSHRNQKERENWYRMSENTCRRRCTCIWLKSGTKWHWRHEYNINHGTSHETTAFDTVCELYRSTSNSDSNLHVNLILKSTEKSKISGFRKSQKNQFFDRFFSFFFRLTELRVLVTPGMSWDEFSNRV